MTPEEEHQLARGVNALHDEGSVHATDLEKVIKFLEIASPNPVPPNLREFAPSTITKGRNSCC